MPPALDNAITKEAAHMTRHLVAGATLGGIGLKGLAKKRIEALEANDTRAATEAERRALPIEILLTGLVLVTVVAMVHRWGS